MKKSILQMILIGFVCFAASSCGNVIDSDQNVLKTPEPPGKVFADKFFVNTPGSSWKYTLTDTSEFIVDTVDIEIKSNEFYPSLNSFASLWTYTYKNHPGNNYSRYLIVKDSSVYQYNSINDTNPILLYKFPLDSGSSWYVGHSWDTFEPGQIDSAKVYDIVTKTINGKSYVSYVIYVVFQVNPGLYTSEFIQYVPGIGIVYVNQAPGYTVNRVYDLIDFHLIQK